MLTLSMRGPRGARRGSWMPPGRRDIAPKVSLGGLSGKRIQSFALAKLLNPFCHEVAKSNDNARAEGAYNGIVSLYIYG